MSLANVAQAYATDKQKRGRKLTQPKLIELALDPETAKRRHAADYFLRWRILALMRRFFLPTLRRPLPVFFVPTLFFSSY
jgi:hypothetical protein